jgi:hypothetical protein
MNLSMSHASPWYRVRFVEKRNMFSACRSIYSHLKYHTVAECKPEKFRACEQYMCIYGAAACTNCGAVFLRQLLRPIKYYFILWMEFVLETRGCRVVAAAAVIIIICVPSGSADRPAAAAHALYICASARGRLSTLRRTH